MDKITKALQKLSDKERQKVKLVLSKLLAGQEIGLDIKKLKDRDDIFRVRVRDLRIIYRIDPKEKIVILAIARRNEKTYKIGNN
jgi:mRNA-degrading endonuclease RelE of RelBE toxin-antitoxin system